MEDKKRLDFLRRKELGDKMQSIMAHPEFGFLQTIIEEEVVYHQRKAANREFRQDPKDYTNIVRALDNADAIQAVLNKFDTVLRLGKEAKEELDKADGINQPVAEQ